MATNEYFVKVGKIISGPVPSERISAIWKAGKLPEHAAISPDRVNWTNIKEFLGLNEPEQMEADVVEEALDNDQEENSPPPQKKTKNGSQTPTELTPDIAFVVKVLGDGGFVKNIIASFVSFGGLLICIFGFIACIAFIVAPVLTRPPFDRAIISVFSGFFMIYPVYLCSGIVYSTGSKIRKIPVSNFQVAPSIWLILDGLSAIVFILFIFLSVPIGLYYVVEVNEFNRQIFFSIFAGLIVFSMSILLAFFYLILLKFFKESLMVIFSIAVNVDIIAGKLKKIKITSDKNEN